MRPFEYERPASLEEALGAIAPAVPGAVVLAGGTDLIIGLRDGSIRADRVVDIKDVAELDGGIRELDGRLVIGCLALMEDIALHPRVRERFVALAEAAAVVGSVQIRNRATLAGNICNASPAADTAPALLVYRAEAVVAGQSGSRRIPIDDFFVGPGQTALAPGELVTAIELPLGGPTPGATHVRRTRRRGHDLASVTLACAVGPDGGTRLAYGSVGPRPFLGVDSSGALADPRASTEARLAVLDRLFAPATPSATSLRASPAYRLAMLRVLGLRALEVARGRASGGAAA